MTEFTAEQRAAIERRGQATLLDAGAGSGKTSVLVERFVRAVLEDGVAGDRILAITFTEKAAAELRERVRRRLRELGAEAEARATEEGWISTIHAFCARVLRADPLAAGIDPHFAVLDEETAERLSQEAFEAAVAEVAGIPAGVELLAAFRTDELWGAVSGAHASLRARGERAPALPLPVPSPDPARRAALRATVCEAASAAARELGGVPNPGTSIRTALEVLDRVSVRLEAPDLWPGELDGLRLSTAAGALRSDTCDAYRAALAELRRELAGEIATGQLAVLDRLLRAYAAAFAERKQRRGAVDFDDLELLARDLLRTSEVGDRYRARFTHVMVDELQDSSAVQHELVDLLCGGGAVPFMVGDAQQSIYGFRHAHVEGFEARGRRLEPEGGRLSLQTNFRTRAEILTVINAGFAAAQGDRFRPLRAGRRDPPAADARVELLAVDKGAEWEDDSALAAPWRAAEARGLAARIAALIATDGCRAADIVVLTRATTDLRVYERELERRGIPTFVVGGRGYWRAPEVLELAAYVRALANPLDQEALYTVLLSPLCGLSLDGLVLHAAGALGELAAEDRERLAAFEAWFGAERDLAPLCGPEELIERAVELSGFDRATVARPGGIRALANVRKLLRLAREHEAEHGPDVYAFAQLVARRSAGRVPSAAREAEAPVESEALDAVRLMTIHRAKGLEFPVVCVADLGRAPRVHAPLLRLGTDGRRLGLRIARAGEGTRVNALDYEELKAEADAAEMEEAKRLFYVAMTRAREGLILSGAAKLERPATGDSVPMEWILRHFRELPGVRCTAVTEAPRPAAAAPAPGRPPASGPEPPSATPTPPPAPPRPPALAARAPVETISYTGLAEYHRCGLRFKAERVLGLPPTPVAAEGGRRRGIELHEALRDLDLARPGSIAPAPDPELAPPLAALLASPTVARLRAAVRLERELPFAFALGPALITGVFDALASETDGLLVVDYKSDRLQGAEPEALVADRYALQRLIYAIAALRTGADGVEVRHLFLERPDRPAVVRHAQAERAELETRLDAAVAPLLAGRFTPSEAPRASLCAGCPAAGGLCPHPPALTRRADPERLF
jgi:ATP-dependent exoDNAse (exonuclease V) beta subunit